MGTTIKKEPDWSTICNNVFDQYINDDDPFGFGNDDLFDFCEQSRDTEATSPIPAQQPQARVPMDFWHKKLRALEENVERNQTVPGSPTDQSYSAQRQRSRTANGRTPTKQRSVNNLRSVSRGRPQGVTKVPTRNASPSKMMTPSRYRGGFKDVWAERIEASPSKYELRMPPAYPESPPPSSRSIQETFAAFGSPVYPVLPGCDDQISPLANTFQQSARIGSPGEHVQMVPLNDTAPLYPESTSYTDFNFGFSDLNDPWITEPDTFNLDSHTQNGGIGLGVSNATLPGATLMYPSLEESHLPQASPTPSTEVRSRKGSGRHHRRTKSAGTPRNSEKSGGGFVNYTPMDSNKILSGVAPSGSSKTKARREKEAAEKRRKLSQAAMQAVIEAGGDVEALTKVGLM